MSLLKHWQEQRAAAEQAKAENKPEERGAGRPSPENAVRTIEDRCNEALELLGELTEFYNERASVLEHEAHLPCEEAERRAMSETKASETYRRWLALG